MAARPPGLTGQGAALEPASDAAIHADFAATLLPRGLPLRATVRVKGQGEPVTTYPASTYSGIPTRRLWSFIAAGKLPVVRVPGMRAVLVLRDDLDALLLAHRGAPAHAPEARQGARP
jgi:hypothetical protein